MMVWLMAVAVLAGCGTDPQRGALPASGPEIQIGAGIAHDTVQGGDHEWTAWLYRAQGVGPRLVRYSRGTDASAARSSRSRSVSS
jgi:hypothetical protein